jgi:hypothetical protein
MRRHGSLGSVVILGLVLGLCAVVDADAPRPGTAIDVHALYERLQPGMTVREVVVAAGRSSLLASPEPVTAWVLWNPPVSGRPTAVLRAVFREGRLGRVEYESFGEEYVRRAKGADPAIEIGEDELRRLWRQVWQSAQAAGQCRDALEAFHQLVLHLQERLTATEQATWVQALELRRTAEAQLERLDR